jgi:plastocyanin
MFRKAFCILAVTLGVAMPAQAATVSVALKDTHGAAASDAVITLTPVGASLASRVADDAVIDQRQQMFTPLVVVVRRGGRVVFTNNDDTMHQVYSFSAIKQFQQEIEKHHRSTPVVFDKAGVAAIGCNIHDDMIAYVVVAEAPIAVVSDAKGQAEIADVPAGKYTATIWHPRMMPNLPLTFDVTVTGDGASIARTLSLMPDKMSGMHKQHMQSY